jgi:hypothetical protein
MAEGSLVVGDAQLARALPRAGDYLCSDRVLYQVERVLDDHALIEDCKSYDLIEVTLEDLTALRPVRPASTA